MPAIALIFNAFVWGVSWFPFRQLEGHGLHPVWTKLADVGIHGNGHMMMLETNNLEIASVMSRWLDKVLSGAARPARRAE